MPHLHFIMQLCLLPLSFTENTSKCGINNNIVDTDMNFVEREKETAKFNCHLKERYIMDNINFIFYIIKEIIKLIRYFMDKDIKQNGQLRFSTVIALSLVLLSFTIDLAILTAIAYIFFEPLL